MYLFQRINAWSEKHHPAWIDILRILLGVILVWKAIYFIVHKSAIIEIVHQYGFGFYTMTAAHAIIGIHLAGGLLIIGGLFTRIAAAIQLPVILGNIIFVIIPNGFMTLKSEAELTLIILVLTILFIIEGSGKHSLDYYLQKHPS